jgi:hypothetical protein
MRPRKTAYVSLRLDPELKQNAEKAARDDCRTLSSLAEVLLHRHCKGQESDAAAPAAAKSSKPRSRPAR